jgi:hypothetical protein
MKKGFVLCAVLIGCIVLTGSMATAMDAVVPGGCCGANEMDMECSSMGSCDHDACTCHSSLESDSVCACCAMDMLTAIIDINPGNVNVKSKGRFITVYIEMDDPDDLLLAYSIDTSSIYLKKADDTMIRIDGQKLFTDGPAEYGDYDENGTADLMVKFDRQDLIGFFIAKDFGNGEVSISLSGKLYDGTKFKGAQTITISGNK